MSWIRSHRPICPFQAPIAIIPKRRALNIAMKSVRCWMEINYRRERRRLRRVPICIVLGLPSVFLCCGRVAWKRPQLRAMAIFICRLLRSVSPSKQWPPHFAADRLFVVLVIGQMGGLKMSTKVTASETVVTCHLIKSDHPQPAIHLFGVVAFFVKCVA